MKWYCAVVNESKLIKAHIHFCTCTLSKGTCTKVFKTISIDYKISQDSKKIQKVMLACRYMYILHTLTLLRVGLLQAMVLHYVLLSVEYTT